MSLPTMEQRATYVRAFVWAMPERVQQVGCTATARTSVPPTLLSCLRSRLPAIDPAPPPRPCPPPPSPTPTPHTPRTQFGLMLALGLDPVTWYRLKRMVPDLVPRGEAGWKHF